MGEVQREKGKIEVGSAERLASLLNGAGHFCLVHALKHSGVKRIEVQLKEVPNEIHLMVTDLGTGFAVEGAFQGQGLLGLTSMQERVRLLKGSIEIQSKPMGGTTVHVRVPLTEQIHQRQAV